MSPTNWTGVMGVCTIVSLGVGLAARGWNAGRNSGRLAAAIESLKDLPAAVQQLTLSMNKIDGHMEALMKQTDRHDQEIRDIENRLIKTETRVDELAGVGVLPMRERMRKPS